MTNVAYQGVETGKLVDTTVAKRTPAQIQAAIKALQNEKRAAIEAELAAKGPAAPRGRGVWRATYKVVVANPKLTDTDKLYAAVCSEIKVADKDGKKTSKDLVAAERRYFVRICKWLVEEKVDLTKIDFA